MTTSVLSDAILSKLESLQDLAADCGLRIAVGASGIGAAQLTAALAGVELAPPPPRHLLARRPCHEGPETI
jgi:hypothetical protein